MSEKLSTQELLVRIDELGKEDVSFHCIDLGNGVKNKTKSVWGESVDNPMPLWNKLKCHIPQDLTGIKVLDVGCNAGFFSIEAKRRNAAYVLGVDAEAGLVKQAEFARDVLNLDIEYRKMDVYELPELNMEFDLVLCLGVIYHCKYPLKAAESVAAVCAQSLIVESVIWSKDTFTKGLVTKLARTRLASFLHQTDAVTEDDLEQPLWHFVFGRHEPALARGAAYPNPARNDGSYNWWFPNMQGLKAVFRTVGFASVESLYQTTSRGAVLCTRIPLQEGTSG
jgi:tRNA (mo5U34)-methyltransferase